MISVGLVGAGYWGPNLARNLAASDRAELGWVCDLDPATAGRLAARYPRARPTDRMSDLLEDPDLDAVMIVTPPSTHASIVEQALRAGKHVLVEKPLAVSRDEASELCKLAEDGGLVLMTDHTYCYSAAVAELRRAIGAGELGEVLYYDAVRINLGRLQPDVNVLWDLAPHDVSILLSILPPTMRPVRVAATLADPIGFGQASIGHLYVQFPGDALAHIHCNWLSPKKVRMTIVGGSRRMAVWDDLTPDHRVAIYDAGVSVADSMVPDDPNRGIQYRIGNMLAPALREYEPLSEVVREFTTAITDKRPPMTDGLFGLRVIEVLEGADRSAAANGAWVELS